MKGLAIAFKSFTVTLEDYEKKTYEYDITKVS